MYLPSGDREVGRGGDVEVRPTAPAAVVVIPANFVALASNGRISQSLDAA